MDELKNVLFTKTHEWVKFEDETTAYIGLSDYAQSEMGDVVFVNLEEQECEVGDTIGDAESVKAVSDIYSPFTGEIVEINEVIVDDPGAINRDPYGTWLCKYINISDKEELLSLEEYEESIKE
ncbi:MAG: glycine cleavage system protein GcvH [Erysipelotrichaceae bacterium]|nr:glycine cleavage system protein GcvH [Erysipelotrichaceae bacterium]